MATIAPTSPRSWPVVLNPASLDSLDAAGISLGPPDATPYFGAYVARGPQMRAVRLPSLRRLLSSRAAVVATLAKRVMADRPRVTWLFEHSFQGLAPTDARIAVLERTTGRGEPVRVEVRFDLLVGADGVRSRVREAMKKLDPRLKVS